MDIPQDLIQIDILLVHFEHSRFGAGQQQKAFYQMSDPIDLLQRTLQRGPVFRGCPRRAQGHLQFAFYNS